MKKVLLVLAILIIILSALAIVWGIYLLTTITTGFESVAGFYPIFFLGIPLIVLGFLFFSLRGGETKRKWIVSAIVVTLLFLISFWMPDTISLKAQK